MFASKITRRRIYIISNTLDHNSTILLDSFLIESTNNKSIFNIQISLKIPSYTSPIPANWDEYLSYKLEWMQQLTRNTKHNIKTEPQINQLQTEVPIIISSNGAKENGRRRGWWIIALIDGTRIVSGFNQNFGKIKVINSYRAQIYASLAVVLFLHLYSEYHSIYIQNQCRSICDNQAYVNN